MVRYLLVLALVCHAPTTVFAQSAGAQAEVLFREGRRLMAAGKFAEACAAFEQSQKFEAATTTLLNLAGCREKNRQLATAWGLFLEAERQTRTIATDAGRELHGIALDRARKLEPRVSKLTIRVRDATKVDGLEISRDETGIEVATWNRALPVDGGAYTIRARAPGMIPWSTRIVIAPEGDTKTVDVPDLMPDPISGDLEDRSLPGEPRIAPAGASKAIPIAIGAGAVVLGGAALGLELWGESTYNRANEETTDQSRRDSLFNSANTKRYVAEGLLAASVASAGFAVWWYLRGPRTRGEQTRRSIVVSPAGLAIAGSF